LGLNYTIQYKKGVDNKAADTLSRKGAKEGSEMLAVTELIPTWLSELKDSYLGDAWATQILNNQDSSLQIKHPVSIHQEIIRYKRKIYVGSNQGWRGKIVQSLHDSSVGGHSGIQGTYQRVKALFY
jgi:Integrase zinc binding domain